MAESDEEFERIFKIVFSTAGKNAFIEPFAVEGLRSWLGVPREIGDNDPRLMADILKISWIPSLYLVNWKLLQRMKCGSGWIQKL